jgi:hypothetical protein
MSVPTVRVIDADMFFRVSCEVAVPEPMLRSLFLKGQRRRSKNSGGGIAPAAIAGLIECRPRSVNAQRLFWDRKAGREKADKVLMRLNFPCCTVNG